MYQYNFNGMWMNTGTSRLCFFTSSEKYFLNMRVHCRCSHWGSDPSLFSFWHYRHVFGLFTDWLQRHWTQEPQAWDNVDWTKHQSGASRIAGCRSFQKHGIKLIWIVSVNFDCFLKFNEFSIQMALPTDILWPYCNSAAEMTFVCLGSVVDL
jgi:hypothetical protein